MAHIDAVAHADQLARSEERTMASIEREERSLSDAFIKACEKVDANAMATFGPMVTDWDAMKRRPVAIGEKKPVRTQLMHEILADSFDYKNGPDMSELMQLVLNVAYGSDTVNQPAAARRLLERAADAWAYYNAGA